MPQILVERKCSICEREHKIPMREREGGVLGEALLSDIIFCDECKKRLKELIYPPQINIYDEEEIRDNCTVQILRNSVTGDVSVGWWENVGEGEDG